jgi:hypothetical protein
MNLMRWISNKSAAVICGLCCAAAALAAQASPATNAALDEIFLRDGDSMDGKLLGVDPKGGVRWQNPDVAEPIEFKLDGVAQIRFQPATEDSSKSAETELRCKLSLAGGDVLEGTLVSCDRSNLVLRTRYAGALTIARKSVQSVYFAPTTPDIFTQTTGDGWVQGKAAAAAFSGDPGDWIFRDGAFYASKSASIARDIKLPDSADIQFDLAWSGSLSLSVALYTDSLLPVLLAEKDNAPSFGGFYSLQLVPGPFANLSRVKKKEPYVGLDAPVAVAALGQTNQVHVEVRARKVSSIVTLTVDGALVHEWHDTNGFAGEGTGIRFVHNMGGSVKLSDLRVTPWDGASDQGKENVPAAGQDFAALMNGTTLTGEIVDVKEGKMTLRGKQGQSVVSLGQIRRLTFTGSKEPAANTNSGTVLANLVNGGRLTFQLDKWSADGVEVRSPAFGAARFSPDAFVRILFSPPGGSSPASKTPPSD